MRRMKLRVLLLLACLSASHVHGSSQIQQVQWLHTRDDQGRDVFTKALPSSEAEDESKELDDRRLAASGGLVEPVPFDAVCHVALLIEAVAFMQTDITYLRLLEVSASALVVYYAVEHTKGNWYDCHVLWGLVHCFINMARVFYSYYKLWSVHGDLTDEERYLREHHLSIFSPLEFAALKSNWKMCEVKEGEALMTKGEAVKSLVLIHSGWANVVGSEGKVVAQVGEGQFLGEMAFFTDEPASATIQADGLMTVVKWELKEVKHHSHSHHHSETASAFKKLPSLFCRDLAAKMKAANEAKAAQKSFFGRKSRFSILSNKGRFTLGRFSAVSRRMNQRGTGASKRETMNKGAGRVSLQGQGQRTSIQGSGGRVSMQGNGGRVSLQGGNGGRVSLQGGSGGGGRVSLQGGSGSGGRVSLQGGSGSGGRVSLQGGSRTSLQGKKASPMTSRTSLQGRGQDSPVPLKKEIRVSAAKVAPITTAAPADKPKDRYAAKDAAPPTSSDGTNSPVSKFSDGSGDDPAGLMAHTSKRMETLQPLRMDKKPSLDTFEEIAPDLHDLTKQTQQRQANKAVLRGPSRNMLEHRGKAMGGHRRTLY